jgi:anhydro-N-acetylmuramic acid kinase
MIAGQGAAGCAAGVSSDKLGGVTTDHRLLAGAMSGTSADGVDVALVQVTGRGMDMNCSILRHHHRPYDPQIRTRIFNMRSSSASSATSLADLAALTREISLTYATAVNEVLAAEGVAAARLEALGAHGQTLYHAPPLTLQALDPSLLSLETGCTVVSDFRRADCAAGGQGAPLVPFADYVLFRDSRRSRALLNIGGIANLTYLPAGGGMDKLIAFDTGPGNCISDWICREHAVQEGYDVDGQRAARGGPDEETISRLLASDWFRQPPPKSTDVDDMIELCREGEPEPPKFLEDRLATACLLTARSIVQAMRDFLPQIPSEVIASGGGTENRTMMNVLRHELGQDIGLRTTDELGVPSAAKEAMAFALLAAMTLDGVPGNVPAVTGARRAVVLGTICTAARG